MKEEALVSSKDIMQVDLDLNRTFGSHIIFWDYYGVREMKEEALVSSRDITQIDLDVNRTFGSHIMFWDTTGSGEAEGPGGIGLLHDAVENDHLEIVHLLPFDGSDPTLATFSGVMI
ncbi:hypothetical protein VULLAG_LOCUS17911 [Vulpes lagopus]